jgi:hypothetical protein
MGVIKVCKTTEPPEIPWTRDRIPFLHAGDARSETHGAPMNMKKQTCAVNLVLAFA